jgi:hypothetical protein
MYPPAIDAFPIVVGQGARMMIAGGLIAYGISQTLNVSSSPSCGQRRGQAALAARHDRQRHLADRRHAAVHLDLLPTASFPILELMAGQMLTKVVLSIVLVPFLITGCSSRWAVAA